MKGNNINTNNDTLDKYETETGQNNIHAKYLDFEVRYLKQPVVPHL